MDFWDHLIFFVEDRWIKMLKSNTIAESNLCWPKAMPEAPPRVMERDKDNKVGRFIGTL